MSYVYASDSSIADYVSVGSINLDAESIDQLEEALRQSVLSVLSSPAQMAALSPAERHRIQHQARRFWPDGPPGLEEEIQPDYETGSDSTEEAAADPEMTQDVNLVRTMQMLYEELGSAMLTDMPSFALFDLIRSIAKLVRDSQTATEDEEWTATLELLECSSAGNLLQRLETWPTCNQRLMTCAATSVFEPLFLDSFRQLNERTGGDRQKVVGDYKLGQCDVCCSSTDTLLWSRGCCQTSVCVVCLHRWLIGRLLEVHSDLTCPGCEAALTPIELRHLLSDADMSRREKLIARHHGNSKGERDCPRCSCMTQRPSKRRNGRRLVGRSRKIKKEEGGVVVKCQQCDYLWCFDCHAPVHPGLSCRQFQSGAHQLESWAKQMEENSGLRKARRCSRCKAMIEKNSGCDHMTCTNCRHEFCYRCGGSWDVREINVPFLGWSIFGSHSSRLSVFGCKENFLPNRTALRRLIRGSLFVLRACGLVVVPAVAVAILLPLAAALVGIAIPLSPILVPILVVYFVVRKQSARQREQE